MILVSLTKFAALKKRRRLLPLTCCPIRGNNTSLITMIEEIYDEKYREELLDNDALESFEEAFLIGYEEAE